VWLEFLTLVNPLIKSGTAQADMNYSYFLAANPQPASRKTVVCVDEVVR
jgi:hypothetical protein